MIPEMLLKDTCDRDRFSCLNTLLKWRGEKKKILRPVKLALKFPFWNCSRWDTFSSGVRLNTLLTTEGFLTQGTPAWRWLGFWGPQSPWLRPAHAVSLPRLWPPDTVAWGHRIILPEFQLPSSYSPVSSQPGSQRLIPDHVCLITSFSSFSCTASAVCSFLCCFACLLPDLNFSCYMD